MTTSYEGETLQFTPQEQGPCALVQDLLPLYIEGEVSPGSRDVIVEHLARCERCAGFLAGAQTVRVQLRREQAARPASWGAPAGASAAAAGRALSPLQGFLLGVSLISLSGLGSIGSIMLFKAPGFLQLFGFGLVGLAFGLLLVIGGIHRSWTPSRLMLLVGSCGFGAIASLGLAESLSHDPLGVMIGVMIGLACLAGVWRAVISGDGVATQPAANGAAIAQGMFGGFKVQMRHVVAAGLIIALLVAGYVLSQTVSMTINMPFMFVFLAVAAVIWARDKR